MDNKRILLFIDYSPNGFKRYAESIVKEIRNISSHFRFVAIYMEGTHEGNLGGLMTSFVQTHLALILKRL